MQNMSITNIREIGENINNSGDFAGTVLYDEPLLAHTTMRVGGPAAIFVEPHDVRSLSLALRVCSGADLPYYVLGGGSNLVFGDSGFSGMVVSTACMNSMRIEGEGGSCVIRCGAGARTSALAEFAAENGVAGFTNFAGLPGTVGGACFMNARCYETDFSSVFLDAEYLDLEDGAIRTYSLNEKDWGYKKSPFMDSRSMIILSAGLRGKTGARTAEELRGLNNERIRDRERRGHFKAFSAGSVFKNNRDFGKSSGAIIDEAGLKGTAVGGAQVAPWHGNFIINTGNATADDIKSLVALIQKKVRERTGFYLEPEIIFVN